MEPPAAKKACEESHWNPYFALNAQLSSKLSPWFSIYFAYFAYFAGYLPFRQSQMEQGERL
jgi:hypothetical protein